MMKQSLIYLVLAVCISVAGCKKSDFAESYTNPAKISATSVEKQFAGFLVSNREYVMKDYWNYFVVLRTTVNRYTQAVGWVNSPNQYVPGAAGITSRWENYYNFLAQYRELQKVFSQLSPEDRADRRIFEIAAAIYFYDHTQKMVDLHGDIPWSEAGMLSAKGGDYGSALPKYDAAATIYTTMMDDLKAFADELNTITIKSGIQTGFKNQDIVNKGSLDLWKRYCNSLRVRMLSRVSDVPAFQARYNSEITAILADQAKYPLVTTNAQNIQISVYNLNSDIHSKGFRSGLEDWDGNLAGKVMIDHMKANNDPRLRAMFEPGTNAAGVFTGLDPMANSQTQTALVAGGTLARYNRSTLSRNEYFPGVLITSAEVYFYLSEFALKNANVAAAKTAYNEGIRQSIEFYYWVRTLSNDNTAGPLTPTNAAEIAAYLVSPGVNFDLALTNAEKIVRIATQKWIHYSVVLPLESWAEVRRLDAPVFAFEIDNANSQKQPPVRWLYAQSEATYNSGNYQEVQSADNLTAKIFWDVK